MTDLSGIKEMIFLLEEMEDDIIVGGIGSDKLTGSNGNDKFYYEPKPYRWYIERYNYDFRANGDDLIVSSQAPTSFYNRSTNSYRDTSVVGTNYDITTNHNELPYRI